MYKRVFTVEASDIDPNYELKLSSIFRMMQDAATGAINELNMGVERTRKQNMMWVITRYSVEIYKSLFNLHKVTVITYPGKDMLFIYPRFFELRDENDEVIVRASSTWCVLDRDTRKVVSKPFKEIKLEGEHLDGEISLPRKVEISSLNHIEDRIVRYSDIDLNGHLNNTKYIEYIVDLHSLDFYKKHLIKKFDINYEHEVKYGCKIVLSSNMDDNIELIQGNIDGNDIFNVKIEYEKRQ